MSRDDLFTRETVHSMDETLTSHWDTRAIQGQLPGLHDVMLAVDVIDAGETAVQLQITSPLVCTHEGNGEQRLAQAAPARGAQSPEGRLGTLLTGDRIRGHAGDARAGRRQDADEPGPAALRRSGRPSTRRRVPAQSPAAAER